MDNYNFPPSSGYGHPSEFMINAICWEGCGYGYGYRNGDGDGNGHKHNYLYDDDSVVKISAYPDKISYNRMSGNYPHNLIVKGIL